MIRALLEVIDSQIQSAGRIDNAAQSRQGDRRASMRAMTCFDVRVLRVLRVCFGNTQTIEGFEMLQTRKFLAAVALSLSALPVMAVPINWIDWQDSVTDANGFTAYGQITSGSEIINVTYNNPNGVGFYYTGAPGETDYWAQTKPGVGKVRDAATSPFTSVGTNGVDNIPEGTDMIALRFAGTQTLSFDQAVGNLVFAFISLNRNGYGFDQDFELLSSGSMDLDGNGADDCGWWGCGTSTKDVSGGVYSLLGTGEPHGALRFTGVFDDVSWDSLSNEFWNGFTVGVQGTADQVFGEVPLPPSLWLMFAGLGALGLRARR